jgi:hypothetical protein
MAECLATPQAHEWRVAADEEYKALVDNDVFVECDRPDNKNILTTKWVPKVKLDADGNVARHKMRFVVRGFTQIPGVDVEETYAPTLKFDSLRLLLALATSMDLEVHQMDVKTAFLNGLIDKELYVEPPEGYKPTGRKVWRLRRALYGTQQAPRLWYQRCDTDLRGLGFTRLEADHTVYFRVADGRLVIIGLYVDDLIIISNRLEAIIDIKRELSKLYKMTDLGEASHILGMHIERNRPTRTTSISLGAYIDRILEQYGMNECRTVPTPLEVGDQLRPTTLPMTPEDVLFMRDKPYRSLLGALTWVMVAARPDLSHAVGVLGQFSTNPTPEHWAALMHVLRYVAGTRAHKLVLRGRKVGKEGMVNIVGFADADFASASMARKSISGWLYQVNGCTVSWSSKQQKNVSMSTTEAEYQSTAKAGMHGLWLRGFIGEIPFLKTLTPTRIYNDNAGAVAMMHNPIQHQRAKHIDRCWHFLRNIIAEDGTIDVVWMPTASMPADALTKSLPRVKLRRCTDIMGLLDYGSQIQRTSH